jgi:hypothetical protein
LELYGDYVMKCISLVVASETNGPFGLHRGMTQEQVIQIVGEDAVIKTKDDLLIVLTVPRPHPAFENYVLIFSPNDGLLQIAALGNDITTSVFGDVLQNSFIEIRSAISQTYGKPECNYDYLRAGSIWKEPQDWMMGLFRGERHLFTGWNKSLPNGIQRISLLAQAPSTETGFLTLSYEFEGFGEYLAMKERKAAAVF